MQQINNLDHEEIKTNNDKVYNICVIKDDIFLSHYFGDHSISKRNLTTNKEETIYESDAPILSLTSFHMNNEDFIIFYKISLSYWQFKIDGDWVSKKDLSNAEWRSYNDQYERRHFSEENGQIILFNLSTRREIIITDNLIKSVYISPDISNNIIFVAKTDAYGAPNCYKYSCQFIPYLDIVKNCELIKQNNFDSSFKHLLMIIIDMLDIYYFKKIYLQRDEGASGLYYDSIRNRLYFGRMGRTTPGHAGLLKYLDLNQDQNYKTHIVYKNIASPHGITGDSNGNIYVAGYDTDGKRDEMEGITMFKFDGASLDEDKVEKYIVKKGHHVTVCHFNQYDNCLYFSTGRSTNFIANINIKEIL